jgi:hypothetical protein
LKATRKIAIAANLPAVTSRLHRGLLMVQLGACVLLVIAAIGLLQGARNTAMQDPALEVDRVIDVRVAPSLARRVSERLSSHSEVEGVAFTARPPLFGPLNTAEVSVDGQRLRAGYNFVSPGYFHVLGIPILAGRTFSQSEEGGSVRVAIVSAATARRFWPAGQTLGQTIRVATSRTDEARVESDVTVIGV